MLAATPPLRRHHGPPLARLLGREREIAEIVYEYGRGIAAEEVRAAVSDPLSNSAVRTVLSRLAAKGVVTTRRAGKRLLYLPAIEDEHAQEAAILRVSQDYFAGSLAEVAMAALALAQRKTGARSLLSSSETEAARLIRPPLAAF